MTTPDAPLAVPGRLKVGSDGKVTGPANISYNNPFPCVNGNYGSGAMQGVVMHTMVGNLPGTITVFNNPSYQASSHFGIDQQGNIHQFGPIGKGWIAWAQVAGNVAWYSIEHADNGDPNIPLTTAQIRSSAQLVEMLSAFAGFPLQVTNSVSGRGYGTHEMGGAAWGGATRTGPPPQPVRRASGRRRRAGGRLPPVGRDPAHRLGAVGPNAPEDVDQAVRRIGSDAVEGGDLADDPATGSQAAQDEDEVEHPGDVCPQVGDRQIAHALAGEEL